VRTHYDVLGVAADTPDVVIKAAFRALAKECHPDRANAEIGDTEKFIEIQTAYSVLSKPQSRDEYDAELRHQSLVHDAPFAAATAVSGVQSPFPWASAQQRTADIERICARLGLYSEALSQSFHEAYLRGECGNEPWGFAEEMEKNFFREYFGEDPDVQSLAKLLLLGSRAGAALTLNELVAAGFSSPDKDMRAVVTSVLDQHFPGEKLFAEWLKVKFSPLPAGPPPQSDAAAPVPVEASAAAPTHAVQEPGKKGFRSSLVRPLTLVVVWAVTLYFVLFAALPLMR
jgi:curved DNA-binding protein CbpA